MTRLLALLSDPRTPLVLAALAAAARVLYALVSRLVAPYPRVRAAVEALAALAPDVLRASLQVVAAVTGRPAPRLDAVPVDTAALAEQVSDLRDERDRYAARIAELTASTVPEQLRPTAVPGDEPAPAVTSRHRIAVPR